MKNVFILSLILLLFATCKNSNTQNLSTVLVIDTAFKFVIRDYYDETSKDSHHYSKTYSLKSGILYYDYDYNGYPDNEEEHKQKQLNDSAIDIIKAKLKELTLYQSYKKKFPLEERGMITESGYSLFIKTGSIKYDLQVSGPRPMDIQDKAYDNLAIFYSFIENLFKNK